MVNWYKHDILAWMDGTASLSSGAYRAYHVICQLLYLSEEPIALNERFLAGACNQSVRAFQAAFSELVEAKKLTLESGKISNFRVAAEMFRVEKNRENARHGGEKSGEARAINKKTNKINGRDEAPLRPHMNRLDETRLDETRLERETPSGVSRARRSKTRTALSSAVEITSNQKSYAISNGIHTSRLDSVFTKFKNYHIAKGNLMADWEAAWRTWVSNEVDREKPPATVQSSMVYGDDFQ